MRQELREIFNNVNDWLKYAEAKNFGLLSLCAAIVFGTTQVQITQCSVFYYPVYYVLIPFLILGFTASFFSLTPIVKALTVDELRNHWINKKYFFLKPKDLTTEEQAHILNIHFYESLALSSEKTFEKEFKKKSKDEKDFNDLEMEMVSQILINSRIASLKYAFFKLASWLFVLGFIFSLIVLVVMNFIK